MNICHAKAGKLFWDYAICSSPKCSLYFFIVFFKWWTVYFTTLILRYFQFKRHYCLPNLLLCRWETEKFSSTSSIPCQVVMCVMVQEMKHKDTHFSVALRRCKTWKHQTPDNLKRWLYPLNFVVIPHLKMLLNLIHWWYIHNIQKLDTTYISVNRRMSKENVVTLHNGLLLTHKKKLHVG